MQAMPALTVQLILANVETVYSDELGPKARGSEESSQAQWDALVAAVTPPNGILEQAQLQCADPATINHGFKNVSLTTTVVGGNDPGPRLQAFVKLGEPESSAGYSRASAQLRQALGLMSVPVAVVLCRISDPAAFGPPAKRGQELHKRK